MPEEARFFLRTALYSAGVTAVYWFASAGYEGIDLGYDWAGTMLLAFTVLACALVSAVLLLFARSSRDGAMGRQAGGIGARLNSLVGFAQRAGGTERPLGGGPDVLPRASAWPIVSGIAATLILLGLIYGPWLIVPGVVILVVGAGGWLRS